MNLEKPHKKKQNEGGGPGSSGSERSKYVGHVM